MLEADNPETDPLESSEIGWIPGHEEAFEQVPPIQSSPWPVTLRLIIGEKKRMVEAPLNKAVYIGRIDPGSDVFPEVDLTTDLAASKGVSRRHARVLRQGELVLLEDLGSVNGTFLNTHRLAPYVPESLQNGDILQLGKLQMEIQIHRE